jgi:acetyl-CoA carboxylase biotin carboxyl carrier protein
LSDFEPIPEAVRRLTRLVEENGLSELRYEEGDLKITLRTASFLRAAPVSVVAPAVPVAGNAAAAPEVIIAEAASAAAQEAEDDASLLRVEAPMMGVFYRAPALDTPPFIEIGDTVEIGQTIGLIEAMKVFSEVPSEVAGRVKDIPAKSGALVQPGDALVILEAE